MTWKIAIVFVEFPLCDLLRAHCVTRLVYAREFLFSDTDVVEDTAAVRDSDSDTGINICIYIYVYMRTQVALECARRVMYGQCRQCVAVCCSVLQCVAALCGVLRCFAVCCSVVRCGAHEM